MKWDCKYHVIFMPKRRKEMIGDIRNSTIYKIGNSFTQMPMFSPTRRASLYNVPLRARPAGSRRPTLAPSRPGGEIGRHNGLKIRRLEKAVPVQFRSRAPTNAVASRHYKCLLLVTSCHGLSRNFTIWHSRVWQICANE
jgi:hypothetical protein